MTAATNTPLTGELPYAGYGVWHGSGTWFHFSAPGVTGTAYRLDDGESTEWSHLISYADQYGAIDGPVLEWSRGDKPTQVEAIAYVVEHVHRLGDDYQVGAMPESRETDPFDDFIDDLAEIPA